MKTIWITGLAMMVLLIAFYVGVLYRPSEPTKDIQSVVEASVQSIKSQNLLIVMTSRLNGVATSDQKQYGMEAKQTTIQSADVQYILDLSKFRSDMIHVGNVIEVTIPHSMLSARQLPSLQNETYDNQSMLFSLSGDIREDLTKRNEQNIQKSFQDQTTGLTSQAEDNARQDIKTIIEVLFRVVGVNQPVAVSFK